MKRKSIFLLAFFIVLIPVTVSASSGRLVASSITTCNGQTYGFHGSDKHWHVAEKNGNYWYANGEPLNGNPCNNESIYNDNTSNNNNNSTYSNNNNSYTQRNIPATVIKNSDNTLKEVKINNQSIEVNYLMNYETKETDVKLEAIANDSKATLEYNNEITLNVGDNSYTITVTAENGEKAYYKLNIIRKNLSNNKNFKLFYDDKELTKNTINKTIEDISVDNDVKRIDFKYTLDDKNAKIEFAGNDNLKEGANKVKIIVTAEDSSQESYTIKVDRTSKAVDTLATMIVAGMAIMPLACPLIGGIIVIYILRKRRNTNNENRI